MSEASQAVSDGGVSAATTTTQATAGALLREAREAAGLHIAALAVSLKVPVKKLEALESDRLDLLPDAVFIRALASSVCRTLKIDPAPVLARLPQTAAPRLSNDAAGINAPFPGPHAAAGTSAWQQVSRPAVLAVVALLLAAIVLIFLPDVQRGGLLSSMPSSEPQPAFPPAGAGASTAPSESGGGGPNGAGSGAAPAPAAVPAGGAASNAAATGVATGQAMTSPAEATGTPNGNAAPPGNVPAGATAATSPASHITAPMALAPSVALATASATGAAGAAGAAQPSVSAAAASTPTAAGTPSGIVVFRAKAESWVEVTDARGAVPLRKTLAPGESVGATGALPLSVVVGKADSTQVQVRGKSLDLSAYSRDNVARFEVK